MWRSRREDQLRGLARALVDALVYLKKERVLHRDIKPSNILLTSEWRPKLSGFGSAIRLPTYVSTVSGFCGSANYISPEILSGHAYGFPVDIWSLGCVLLTCLSGLPAFDASNPEDVFDNICSARYALPDSASYEAKDLISGLLQKNPHDRTPIHRLLSHPFFNPALPENNDGKQLPNHICSNQS
ncbi:kinase-like domain-containing protein [Earliella scabrosa]|nr:kinase-like domain-containing protein [Earliella scabrosa]